MAFHWTVGHQFVTLVLRIVLNSFVWTVLYKNKIKAKEKQQICGNSGPFAISAITGHAYFCKARLVVDAF